MADKLSQAPAYRKGDVGPAEWLDEAYLHLDTIEKGPQMSFKTFDKETITSGINSVGLLFQNCKLMRAGTNQNFGFGGSNCPTGDPVEFVDLKSCFVPVFKSDQSGILESYTGPCFILPLCQVGDYPEFGIIMKELYTEFVAQKKGDTFADEAHIANGICAALAATCFALCKEITLNGKVPNEKRLLFLVEALHSLALTAHSVAKCSRVCKNIFDMMPNMAGTADTFQSVLMAFIFDKIPIESIRVKLVGSSIFRHFRNTGWSSDFTEETPVGLVGLLLIAPMLGGMMSSELETPKLINAIVESINSAIKKIVSQFREKKESKYDNNTRHVQNKQILRVFAEESKVPWVRASQIEKIYDAVLRKETNVPKALGIEEHAAFVKNDQMLYLRYEPLKNYPVMIDFKSSTIDDDKNYEKNHDKNYEKNHEKKYVKNDIEKELKVGDSATYISAEPQNWSGLSLKHGNYEFNAEELGNSEFKAGNTEGEQLVSNFRFTAGSDILRGDYAGYAASGLYYNAITKTYEDNHTRFDPKGTFLIKCTYDGIIVSHKNPGSDKESPVLKIKRDDKKSFPFPLISFKYCKITIKFTGKAIFVRPIPSTVHVSTKLSFSDMVSGKKSSNTEVKSKEQKIQSTLDLPSTLKNQVNQVNQIKVKPLRQSAPLSYAKRTGNNLYYNSRK
jgi:hypothetical protein